MISTSIITTFNVFAAELNDMIQSVADTEIEAYAESNYVLLEGAISVFGRFAGVDVEDSHSPVDCWLVLGGNDNREDCNEVLLQTADPRAALRTALAHFLLS